MQCMAPAPPPTMTTVSCFPPGFSVLALETKRPTLDFSSFSEALTTILPSLTVAENFQSESRPGASSISPVQTSKQAPCQGQTTLPSCDKVPSSKLNQCRRGKGKNGSVLARGAPYCERISDCI